LAAAAVPIVPLAPGAIVDHNRLAQNFVELLPEHATQDV
jgi:hypothetical protein